MSHLRSCGAVLVVVLCLLASPVRTAGRAGVPSEDQKIFAHVLDVDDEHARLHERRRRSQ